MAPNTFRNRAVMPVVGDACVDVYGSRRKIEVIAAETFVTYRRDGEDHTRTITLSEWHDLCDACEHERAMDDKAHDKIRAA